MSEIQQIGPANVANVYCQMAKVIISRLRRTGQWRTHPASRALFHRTEHPPAWTRSTLSLFCPASSTSAAGMQCFLHTPEYVPIPLFEDPAVPTDRPDCLRALFTSLLACADRNTSSHRTWHFRIHAAAPHARPRPRDGTHPPGDAPQYSAPAPHNLRVALRRVLTSTFGRDEHPRVMGAPRATVLTCHRCAILRTAWHASACGIHDEHEHMRLIAGPSALADGVRRIHRPQSRLRRYMHYLRSRPRARRKLRALVTLLMIFPGRPYSLSHHIRNLYP